MITLKNDEIVNLALHARSLNNVIQKNQYKMLNHENLLEQGAGKFNMQEEGTLLFTPLDMLYAYGQLELDPETAKHSNF